MKSTVTCRVDHQELLHFRAECRFISVLLSLSMILNMVEPAILIFQAPYPMVARTASLTIRPDWIALFFVQACVLLIPYVWVQAFRPDSRARRWVTKLACFGLCVGSALWLLLAYLSTRFEIAVVTGLFLRNSGGAVTFALALAISLNNEQLRGLQKLEA